ncbi:MAG: hypothetical protein Q4E37_06835 [Tissierellia bacterium]|nr:hypothetical protein [Tissierellia bacterium]
MKKNLYGVYETEDQALLALDALLASGLKKEKIHLVNKGDFDQGLDSSEARALWEELRSTFAVDPESQESLEAEDFALFKKDLEEGKTLILLEEEVREEEVFYEERAGDEDLAEDQMAFFNQDRDPVFLEEGESLDLLLKQDEVLLETTDFVPPLEEEGDWKMGEQVILLYRDHILVEGKAFSLKEEDETL